MPDQELNVISGVPTLVTTSDNIEDCTNDADAVAVGDAVYLSAAGKVSKAANTVTAQECFGLVFEVTDSTNCRVITQGRIIDWGAGLTTGTRYYLHSTAGALTTTKPTTAAVQQVVGIAFSATDLYVCPLLGTADSKADASSGAQTLNDTYDNSSGESYTITTDAGPIILTGGTPALRLNDDYKLAVGNDADVTLGWDTTAFTGIELLYLDGDSSSYLAIDAWVAVISEDGAGNSKAIPCPTNGGLIYVKGEASHESNSQSVGFFDLTNTDGTTRSSGVFAAVQAQVVGKAADTGGDYYAFWADNCNDGGSPNTTFTGLNIGSSYDVGIKVGSGTFDFDGTAFDLDPTGAFTLDMAASQTVTFTLADNTGHALLIQEGANAYIDVDTTNGSERVTFEQTLRLSDNVYQWFGSDGDALLSWDTTTFTAVDVLHLIGGSGTGVGFYTDMVLAQVTDDAGDPVPVPVPNGGSMLYSYHEANNATADHYGIVSALNNKEGTARTSGSSEYSAFEARLSGNAGDTNAAPYYAFRADSVDDAGGAGKFVALQIEDGYNEAIRVTSGRVYLDDDITLKFGTDGDYEMWFDPDTFASPVLRVRTGSGPGGYVVHENQDAWSTASGASLVPLSMPSWGAIVSVSAEAGTASDPGYCFKADIDNTAGTTRTGSNLYGFFVDLEGNASDTSDATYHGLYCDPPVTNGGSANYIGVNIASGYDTALRIDQGHIEFAEISSDPTNVTNSGMLYTKPASGTGATELYYENDAGNVEQVTGYAATTWTAQAGEAISKGDLVCVATSAANRVFLARNDGNDSEKNPVGIALEDIASSSTGLIATLQGSILQVSKDLSAAGYSLGDLLYLDGGVNQGLVTDTPPTTAGYAIVAVGRIVDLTNDMVLFYPEEKGEVGESGYFYVQRTADSTPTAGEFNLFATNGGTIGTPVTSGHVTFVSSTGVFTIGTAGIWEINASAYLVESVTNTPMTSFRLRHNGISDLFFARPGIHSSVDPVCRSCNVIANLAASDTVELRGEAYTSANLTSARGTCITFRLLEAT